MMSYEPSKERRSVLALGRAEDTNAVMDETQADMKKEPADQPKPKASSDTAKASVEKLKKLSEADILQTIRHARNAAEQAAEHVLGANPIIGLDSKQFVGALGKLVQMISLKPNVIVNQELKLLKELSEILLGKSEIKPEKGDRRFSHPIWLESSFYRFLMQSYLAWRSSLHGMIDEADYSEEDKERARYVLSLLTEAVAPTNTFIGNPGAVKNAIDSKGTSLLRGFFHFIDDLKNNGGMPKQVDDTQFKLGHNIGSSDGAVVFRNQVLEVIQYQPKTEKVYKRPILIVPPQINKFYVVDISEKKSFIKYSVEHELQPFVISWRNPTAAQADWNLETYLQACIEAIEAICDITGSDTVNVLAACVGGYTAATLLGHLEASNHPLINSITYLVTVLDTRAPTLMGLFATEEAVKTAIKRSRQKGVLEGRDMARVFAWLRPNDLIWGYVANNYLMGNEPPAFDILYWNADTTRLPAEFHADILTLFTENALAHPGMLNVLGTPIDLSKSEVDTFIVAGITDHITPWKACYETRNLVGGNKTFVLSSSGHVQSIVNPPGNPKAKFYTNSDLSLNADEWLSGAELHAGSWWDHWREVWLSERSDAKVEAPKQLGSEKYPAGDKAPGRYVHQV